MCIEAENPRVDLPHSELIGRGGLLLDDLLDVSMSRPANNAAISRWIIHLGRNHSGCGFGYSLRFRQVRESFRADQRTITHKHDQPSAELRQPVLAAHDRMPGAQL